MAYALYRAEQVISADGTKLIRYQAAESPEHARARSILSDDPMWDNATFELVEFCDSLTNLPHPALVIRKSNIARQLELAATEELESAEPMTIQPAPADGHGETPDPYAHKDGSRECRPEIDESGPTVTQQ